VRVTHRADVHIELHRMHRFHGDEAVPAQRLLRRVVVQWCDKQVSGASDELQFWEPRVRLEQREQ
jgi:hypothetical protein